MITQRNPKVWQEIHCTSSGGGCGGFILVKIDVSINQTVTLICPKCKHKHQRVIKNGQITESGRFNNNPQEELCPTIAAWSETPRTRCMQKIIKDRDYAKERDGVIIKHEKDFITHPNDIAETILRESWTDKFLGKLIG
jgi:hypothetical protein